MKRAAGAVGLVMTYLSVTGRIFYVLAAVGMFGFVQVVVATDGWEPPSDGLRARIAVGIVATGFLAAASVRVIVRDGWLTVVNFASVWRMPIWSVISVSSLDGLSLVVDPETAPQTIPVTAIQGSLIETIRGNPRSGRAIRNLQVARARSPWIDPATQSPRRQPRWGVAGILVAVAIVDVAAPTLIAVVWSMIGTLPT